LDDARLWLDAAWLAPILHWHRRVRSKAVTPLRWLTHIFVNTFGITAPTPENEAKAGRVIALMLAAVAMALGMVAWLLRSALTR
jgi:hypothetical protein